MSSHCNLIRDGYEMAAERVSAIVRHRPRKQMVSVSDGGKIRVDDPCKLAEYPLHTIVGTYDRSVRVEVLEDDLLFRLRELRAA